MAKSYTVVSAETPELLADTVKQRLAEGWICQGGVAVAVFPTRPEEGNVIAGGFNPQSGAFSAHVSARPYFFQALTLP
jgi:hypothetical protein